MVKSRIGVMQRGSDSCSREKSAESKSPSPARPAGRPSRPAGRLAARPAGPRFFIVWFFRISVVRLRFRDSWCPDSFESNPIAWEINMEGRNLSLTAPTGAENGAERSPNRPKTAENNAPNLRPRLPRDFHAAYRADPADTTQNQQACSGRLEEKVMEVSSRWFL